MPDLSTEFVSFVLERLPANADWPRIWDEAQTIARRRAFHGMGYTALMRANVPLSLNNAEKLGELVDQRRKDSSLQP